jgi:hypothetical protein
MPAPRKRNAAACPDLTRARLVLPKVDHCQAADEAAGGGLLPVDLQRGRLAYAAAAIQAHPRHRQACAHSPAALPHVCIIAPQANCREFVGRGGVPLVLGMVLTRGPLPSEVRRLHALALRWPMAAPGWSAA